MHMYWLMTTLDLLGCVSLLIRMMHLKLLKVLQKEFKKKKVFAFLFIRSDHITEFKNEIFKTFCNENGISYTFSSPRTPQQNGVVERKNRTLLEMARIMLREYNLPLYFWAKVVNTSCYIANRVFKRSILNKTSYELWNN